MNIHDVSSICMPLDVQPTPDNKAMKTRSMDNQSFLQTYFLVCIHSVILTLYPLK